jgi:MYXO-CTERM domain-containing protein
MRYSPEEATEDLVLYLSGLTEQEQMRFIEPNEKLEWKFPVCGIGMVNNPGTCDYESPYAQECGGDDGCGCAATEQASHLGWFAMLGLVGLGVRTRRRLG